MCLAFCGSALAATRTLAPARQKAASVEFKLKKIAPADIKSASLTVGKKKLALKLSVIRKAASKGVLKVKLPKSLRKGKKKPRVRLRLVLADPKPSSPAPPGPPAPQGPPGPTGPTMGQIVLVHDSQPDDPQDFAYTAGGGLSPTSFSLDDDADGTLSNSRTFADVPAGSGYSLAQAAPGGWDKASATCDDGSPVTTSI